VSLQVKRSRWQVLRVGKRSFNTQPPSMSVHDICTDLVSAARKDAEQNGEGQRYRARLRCRLDGHEYSRFANVRCILDDGGALTIVDDGDSDTDNPLKVLSDTAQRYAEISWRCLQEVRHAVTDVRSTLTGMTEVATSLRDTLTIAGKLAMEGRQGQVELARIQLDLQRESHAFELQKQKIEGGFGLLEGPVSTIGDEIAAHVVENLRRQRQGGSAPSGAASSSRARKPGTKGPCEHALTVNEIFASLDEDKTAKLKTILADDEWTLLQNARNAQTDAMFDQLFDRFYAELRKRDEPGGITIDAWIKQVTEVIGFDSIRKLGTLIKRLEDRKRAAAGG